MKRIISVHIFLLFFTSFMHLNAQWARTYGGSHYDNAYSIQQADDGGYIVAGSTYSFGAEYGEGIWVLKLSQGGDIEWQYVYKGGYLDNTCSIRQTSDGGYVVSSSMRSFDAESHNYDFWILKLTSVGDIEWQRTYGGSHRDIANSIQQTDDGGYIVAGSTSFFGAEYGKDIWVLKLSQGGDIEWQYIYDGGYFDYTCSIRQTSDGGYIVAGATDSFSNVMDPDQGDMLIIKLTSAGDIEWQRTYGGSGGDGATVLQQTNDGGLIVAGFKRPKGDWMNSDLWILKLTSVGDIEWQRLYGGSGSDKANSIQQTDDGGYIVAGGTESFGAGYDKDIWVLKLSQGGDIEWEYTYGGIEYDGAYSIQQIDDGGYIVAGAAESFIFPSLPHQTDMLILSLSLNGSIAPSCGLIGNSNAIISYTNISPQDTDIIPQDTNISCQDTNIIPQVTRAIIMSLCEKYNLAIFTTSGGTTNPSPDSYTFYSGTEVQIEAIPESGYEFSKWSGDASGTTNPVTIIMDSDSAVTANFTEVIGEDGEKSELPCFIAKAAYGSLLHPHVKALRDFRNKYLMSNKLGRTLVNLYYKYSPFIANLIAKHKALKVAVRFYLIPLVAFSYSMVHLDPIITTVILVSSLLLPIFFIAFWKRYTFKSSRNRDVFSQKELK